MLQRAVLRLVTWLSAIGLAASLAVHVLDLFAESPPSGGTTWALHLGVFAVWTPIFLTVHRLTGGRSAKEFWRTVWGRGLRNCPAWMRLLAYGFLAYALVRFALTVVLPILSGAEPEVSDATDINAFRGFSSHLMALYAAALPISYSLLREGGRRCPAGHPVGPAEDHCTACGQPVAEAPAREA